SLAIAAAIAATNRVLPTVGLPDTVLVAACNIPSIRKSGSVSARSAQYSYGRNGPLQMLIWFLSAILGEGPGGARVISRSISLLKLDVRNSQNLRQGFVILSKY